MILTIIGFAVALAIAVFVAWCRGYSRGLTCASGSNNRNVEVVGAWVVREFGEALERPLALDERGLRVAEEAIELAQAFGTPKDAISAMIDRVYRKEPGLPARELAQTLITVFAAAYAARVDLDEAFDEEWDRILDCPPGYFADRMRRKVENGHAIEKVTKDGRRSSPL